VKNEIKNISPSKSMSVLKESINAPEFIPYKNTTELNINANTYQPVGFQYQVNQN